MRLPLTIYSPLNSLGGPCLDKFRDAFPSLLSQKLFVGIDTALKLKLWLFLGCRLGSVQILGLSPSGYLNLSSVEAFYGLYSTPIVTGGLFCTL